MLTRAIAACSLLVQASAHGSKTIWQLAHEAIDQATDEIAQNKDNILHYPKREEVDLSGHARRRQNYYQQQGFNKNEIKHHEEFFRDLYYQMEERQWHKQHIERDFQILAEKFKKMMHRHPIRSEADLMEKYLRAIWDEDSIMKICVETLKPQFQAQVDQDNTMQNAVQELITIYKNGQDNSNTEQRDVDIILSWLQKPGWTEKEWIHQADSTHHQIIQNRRMGIAMDDHHDFGKKTWDNIKFAIKKCYQVKVAINKIKNKLTEQWKQFTQKRRVEMSFEVYVQHQLAGPEQLSVDEYLTHQIQKHLDYSVRKTVSDEEIRQFLQRLSEDSSSNEGSDASMNASSVESVTMQSQHRNDFFDQYESQEPDRERLDSMTSVYTAPDLRPSDMNDDDRASVVTLSESFGPYTTDAASFFHSKKDVIEGIYRLYCPEEYPVEWVVVGKIDSAKNTRIKVRRISQGFNGLVDGVMFPGREVEYIISYNDFKKYLLQHNLQMKDQEHYMLKEPSTGIGKGLLRGIKIVTRDIAKDHEAELERWFREVNQDPLKLMVLDLIINQPPAPKQTTKCDLTSCKLGIV